MIYGSGLLQQFSEGPTPSEDVPPNNIARPELVGETEIGSMVSARPGLWTGVPAPEIRTALLVDGVLRRSPYRLRPEDDGKEVTVADTASNASGEATISSPCVRVVYPAPQALGIPVDVTFSSPDDPVTIDAGGFFVGASGGEWMATTSNGNTRILGGIDDTGQLIIGEAGRVSVGYTNSGGNAAIIFDAHAKELLAKPVYEGNLDNLSVLSGEPVTIAAGAAFSGTGLVFSATGLPEGLSIDPALGEVAGTFAGAGEFLVTVSARNATGSASGNFSIIVAEPKIPLRIDALEDRSYEVGSGTRYYNIVAEGKVTGTGPVTCFMLPKVIKVETVDIGNGVYGRRALTAGTPEPIYSTRWLLDGSPFDPAETGETIDAAGHSGGLTVEVTVTNTHGADTLESAAVTLEDAVTPVILGTSTSNTGGGGLASWSATNPAYSTGDLVIVAVESDRGTGTTLGMAAGPNGEAVTTTVSGFDAANTGTGGVQLAVFSFIATAGQSSGANIALTSSISEQMCAAVTVIDAGTFNASTPLANVSTNFGPSYTTPAVSPSTTATNAGGIPLVWLAADQVTFDSTPSGWTSLATEYISGLTGIKLMRRDALTTASESIGATDTTLSGGDMWVTAIAIVNPG